MSSGAAEAALLDATRHSILMPMFRVAVAALMHETNTFNPTPTRRQDFRTADGVEIYDDASWHGDNPAWGIIETLDESNEAKAVPLFFARALPGGPVPLEDYLYLRRRIVDRLLRAGAVDGVCIAFHGSMLVPGETDPEGRLAFEIRAIVGRKAPIVAAFDMHAKLSTELESVLDGLTAYKTAPHDDCLQTGRRATHLLLHALRNGARPCLSTVRVPLLLAGEKSETEMPPMRQIIDHLNRVEAKREVLSANLLLGFPWADTPHAGATVALVTDENHQGYGRQYALSVAKELWGKRRRFDFASEACALPEALRRAELETATPVIISDSGDNPTAGASSNMSYCLKHAVETFGRTVLISSICDQATFTEAAALGADIRTTLEIGTTTHMKDEPFMWTCTVERIVKRSDCTVAVLSDGRVTLLLTNRRVSTHEPSLIFDCSLDPATFDVIIVKCGYQGREYRAIAARSIVALTPGDSNENLQDLTFERVPRPIFPIDSGATWRPSD